MRSKKILAVGSVALDSVETPFGKVQDALGGSATFFSASARFFSPVSVVAVVGKDFPEAHLKLLKKLGVDVQGIQKEEGKTFRWKGIYNFDLNNPKTLKTELNVFEQFCRGLHGVSCQTRQDRFHDIAQGDDSRKRDGLFRRGEIRAGKLVQGDRKRHHRALQRIPGHDEFRRCRAPRGPFFAGVIQR